MAFNIEDIHPFHQLFIALMLGLLVGLQRQWAESPLAGRRTFSLISIFGTVSALLAETEQNFLKETAVAGIWQGTVVI